MDRPVKKQWLEPFREHAELEAQEYEASFEPAVPRRTALNRLKRLREGGYVELRGQGRSLPITRLPSSSCWSPSRRPPSTGAPFSTCTPCDLLSDPSAEGALRTEPVGIGRSSYLPPAIPALIETLFNTILVKAGKIRDPFEQAFFAMVHLPYLQPFLDGNKRVSRLAANIPLFRRNLAPLSFVDVPEADYTDGMLAIYELNDTTILREVFLQAYRRSAKRYTVIRGAMGDPDSFRVRYRQAITEQVAEIIRARCGRSDAVAHLRRWVEESVVEDDRKRFVAAAEETLAGIHEGNFARYRIRPSEFEAWKEVWSAPGTSASDSSTAH